MGSKKRRVRAVELWTRKGTSNRVNRPGPGQVVHPSERRKFRKNPRIAREVPTRSEQT